MPFARMALFEHLTARIDHQAMANRCKPKATGSVICAKIAHPVSTALKLGLHELTANIDGGLGGVSNAEPDPIVVASWKADSRDEREKNDERREK